MESEEKSLPAEPVLAAASKASAEAFKLKARSRRRLLICLLGLFCGPLVAEGVIRFFLFGDIELARAWGWRLRNPSRYANAHIEDEYWRLKWSLDNVGKDRVMRTFDPLCGWVGHRVEPLTYVHRDFAADDKRHLLLVYGASYAATVTPKEDSFRALLEESEMSSTHYLINYGVGGYGLGQTYLLMRETLDQHVGQEQTVIIALVADTDFERCVLEFRSAPKPRFRVEAGRLIDPELIIDTPREYLDKHGIGIISYAWRRLLFGSELVPSKLRDPLTGLDTKKIETHTLIRSIVQAIRDDLEERELDYFFLLCTGPRALQYARRKEIEARLLTLLEELDIPYIETRPRLSAARAAALEGDPVLFNVSGGQKNHPTRAGNEVFLELMMDGVHKRYSDPRRSRK